MPCGSSGHRSAIRDLAGHTQLNDAHHAVALVPRCSRCVFVCDVCDMSDVCTECVCVIWVCVCESVCLCDLPDVCGLCCVLDV